MRRFFLHSAGFFAVLSAALCDLTAATPVLAEPDVTVEVQAKPGSDWNPYPQVTDQHFNTAARSQTVSQNGVGAPISDLGAPVTTRHDSPEPRKIGHKTRIAEKPRGLAGISVGTEGFEPPTKGL
jgi:hypothetical protein